MRLGIFGGTFNPIHLAHLVVAERLREELGLGRVLFIPSSLPPHKETTVAGAGHRLEMVRRAVAGNPHFAASGLEIARGGRSYAVDTLRELARRQPGDDIYFLLGGDAFAEIGSWRDAAALFALADFVVLPRPGFPLGDPRPSLPEGLAAGEPETTEGGTLTRFPLAGGHGVWTTRAPLIEISSSDIRSRVAVGRSIRYLVPEEVASYIRQEGLYESR